MMEIEARLERIEASIVTLAQAEPYRDKVARLRCFSRMGMDEMVITYADKAIHRLQKKFSKIVYKGKSAKMAVTATARELAGFIWGMMTESYC